MKHLKSLNESFVPKPIFDLGNQHWFGKPIDNSYEKNVKDHANYIAQQELQISEKSFKMLDRLDEICEKVFTERKQELDAITHNCSSLKHRYQYCAEVVFHTILQGRINALKERPFISGGLMI